MGDEHIPPATAYVGQRDQTLIRIVVFIVWDEQENFWRDPVYGRERVLYAPDQAEHFQRIPFERVRLKPTCVSGCVYINAFYAVLLHLNLVYGHGNPAGIMVQY